MARTKQTARPHTGGLLPESASKAQTKIPIKSYYNSLTGERLENLNQTNVVSVKFSSKEIRLILPTVSPDPKVINIQDVANICFDDKNGFVSIYINRTQGQKAHQILLQTRSAGSAKSIVYAIRAKASWVLLGSVYGLNTSKNSLITSFKKNFKSAGLISKPTTKQSKEEQDVVEDGEAEEETEQEEEDTLSDDEKCSETTSVLRGISPGTTPAGSLLDAKASDEDAVRPGKRRKLDNSKSLIPFHGLIEQVDTFRDGLVLAFDQTQSQATEVEQLRKDKALLEKQLGEKNEQLERATKAQADRQASSKSIRELRYEVNRQSETIRMQDSTLFQKVFENKELQAEKEKLQKTLDEARVEQAKANVELSTYKASEIMLKSDVDSLKDLIGMCISVVDPDKFLTEIRNGSTVSEAHVESIRKK